MDSKKRMDSKKSKGTSKQKAELEELPPKEVQRREEEYNSDLKHFKQGLIAGERFKRDGIIKLAKDLEKAGTVELHKISMRIRNDLATIIDGGYLTTNYIPMVLDDKYKRSKKPPEETETEEEEQETENTNFYISQTAQTTEQSQQPSTPTPTPTPTSSTTQSRATEESRPSPQSIQEERAHDTFVGNIYHHSRNLIEMLTGYNESKILNSKDNLKLVSDTKQYRFLLVMKLSELDAKTIYSDQRTLSLLLNDFLKQLDDNLDARKKKEALTSE